MIVIVHSRRRGNAGGLNAAWLTILAKSFWIPYWKKSPMSKQTSTLDKLHRLELLYRQDYQSDVVDRTLDKIIALENAQTRQELSAIEVRLEAFEREYQMSSAGLHKRFDAGELGDAADFFEWNAFYDMAQSLRQRLQKLEIEAM